MFPDEFEYVAADSVEDAFTIFEEYSDADVEVLAGGHSLIPTMKTGLSSPDVLVDIGDIPALNGITETPDVVEIGAATTYADLLDDGVLETVAPAFHEAVAAVGDIQVRNRGTVGGNLAHADPAADLPGAAIAVDAEFEIRGTDTARVVGVDEMFQGMYMTAVGADELLTTVRIPKHETSVGGTYTKKASPSSGYAMVGVAVSLGIEDDTVVDAGIGANGVMDHGIRLSPVETALEDTQVEAIEPNAIGALATQDLDEAMMMDDLQASGEFRGALLETYTERTIESVIADVTN